MTSSELARGRFTLRDLFALTTVMGMCLALSPMCIPQRYSRESGRSNTCRNNMRNLGLAIIAHEAMRGQYPGYCNDLQPDRWGRNSNNRSLTLAVLPYMDHRAFYDDLLQRDLSNSVIGRQIEVLLCPSDPAAATRRGTPTSFVVNTGQLDFPATAGRTADFPENGVFHRHVPRIPDEPLVTMTANYISSHDGLGNTLMLAENADARNWPDTAERWTGFTYHHADGRPGAAGLYPGESMGINLQIGWSHRARPPIAARGYARPSSHHPNGVNMMFCDNHVRFINDTISYRVFQALMTPHGKGARDNSTLAGAPFPSNHAATAVVKEDEIR